MKNRSKCYEYNCNLDGSSDALVRCTTNNKKYVFGVDELEAKIYNDHTFTDWR